MRLASVGFTLSAACREVPIAHCTLHASRCSRRSSAFALRTSHFTLHTLHPTIYTLHLTIFTSRPTRCTLHLPLSVHCTRVCFVLCTCVRCTVCSVRCTVDCVRYTLYVTCHIRTRSSCTYTLSSQRSAEVVRARNEAVTSLHACLDVLNDEGDPDSKV